MRSCLSHDHILPSQVPYHKGMAPHQAPHSPSLDFPAPKHQASGSGATQYPDRQASRPAGSPLWADAAPAGIATNKKMNEKLYISKTEISIDFECVEDRDLFFLNMASNRSFGFAPQDAAEKVGDYCIRIDPSKFEIAYTWKVFFP